MASATVYGNTMERASNELGDRAILTPSVKATLRHPVDLSGFELVSAIIPEGNSVSDLIEDSHRHMANAIEILRLAIPEVERSDVRLGFVLKGAATLFSQAECLQEAIHDAIVGRNAIPTTPVLGDIERQQDCTESTTSGRA